MRPRIRIFVVTLSALLAMLVVPGAQAASDDQVLYHQALRPITSAVARLQAKGADAPPETLSFEAFGRRFDLTLEPNGELNRQRRSTHYTLYRGRVEGLPDSWVRLMQNGEQLSGMFSDGSDVYVIEPFVRAVDRLVQPGTGNDMPNVIYRLADVILPAGTLSCEARPPVAEVTAADAMDEMIDELAQLPRMRAAGATQRITLGAVADYEFFENFGSDSEAEILARINVVDGIFSSQFGLTLSVQEVDIFDFPIDPFDSTDPGILLDEVSSYRQQNQSQYGLTHLFTYKNLAGTTRGIAWLGGACRTLFGAALSQQRFASLTTGALTAAHEIGHNFNAPHDGEAPGPGDPPNPCQNVNGDFLMSPTITGSSTLSQCSLDQMDEFLATPTASCVTDVGPDGIDLVGVPGSLNLIVDGSGVLNFNITNTGGGSISDVTLEITLAAPLLISSSPAECDLLAGPQPVCTFGTISGGNTLPVQIEFTSAEETSTQVILQLTNSDTPDVVSETLTVNVTRQAIQTNSGDGSGGGGSLGLGAMAALLTAVGLRRRKLRAQV